VRCATRQRLTLYRVAAASTRWQALHSSELRHAGAIHEGLPASVDPVIRPSVLVTDFVRYRNNCSDRWKLPIIVALARAGRRFLISTAGTEAADAMAMR
jgi:hypothetical protein